MTRKVIVFLAVLIATGVTLGLGSLAIKAQDFGSCPVQMVGTPLSCDHAYYINGTYVWMRPLYTALGIASLALLTSAGIIVILLKLRPSAIP